ncbi:MAG: glycosyltransferase family 2 protein [bacterium]
MRNLRSEQKIMSQWKGDPSTPVVSISCTTYNHEPFIEDALEGFLIQETDFPFEILIHDDASTDKTAEIISRYERKYPSIVKPIYQKENQYSKNIKPNQFYNFPRSKGKYIALCEGDDYWIDKKKIQLQKNIIDTYDVSMVVHPAMRISYDNEKLENQIFCWHGNQYKKVDGKEAFFQIGQLYPTASYFIDKIYIDEYILFMQDVNPTYGDFFIEAICSKKQFYYIPRVMSVYRRNHNNSYSYKNKYYNNKTKYSNHHKNVNAVKKLSKYDWIDKHMIENRLALMRKDVLISLFVTDGRKEIKKILSEGNISFGCRSEKYKFIFYSMNKYLYMIYVSLLKLKSKITNIYT